MSLSSVFAVPIPGMRRTHTRVVRPASPTHQPRCHLRLSVRLEPDPDNRKPASVIGLESLLMPVVFVCSTSVLPRSRCLRSHEATPAAPVISFPIGRRRRFLRHPVGRATVAPGDAVGELGSEIPGIQLGAAGPLEKLCNRSYIVSTFRLCPAAAQVNIPDGYYSMCFFSRPSDPYFSMYRSLSNVSISSAAPNDASPGSSVHRRPARLARTSIAASS